MIKRGKKIIFFSLFLFYFSINPVFSQSPVTLTVNDTILKEVNKNILGEVMTLDELHTLHDPSWFANYRSLTAALGPGLIRFSSFRDLWVRSENINYWKAGWNSKGGVVTLDKRFYLVKQNSFDQRINPSLFQAGKKYRLSFDYEATGIDLPNGWDFHGVYLDLYHFEGEIYWESGNGKNFVYFDLPNGSSSGRKTFDFIYSPLSGKIPMVVFLTLNMGAKTNGEVWYDNFVLECLDCGTSINLIKDGDFSLLQTPPEKPGFSYTHLFTSRDFDDSYNFTKSVGAEPFVNLAGFDVIDPFYYKGAFDPNNAALVEEAVLTSPALEEAILTELDMIKYANKEKGYGIKYWNVGSEPEILWTWKDEGFNYGWRADRVLARYKLYGRLFAKLAGRAKAIDPSIKLGIGFAPREFWKESIDGFFTGLKLENPNAPNPDFFTPDPYQLAAWGANPKCADDPTVCIDNLLTYKDPVGEPLCLPGNSTITNMVANLDYISYYDALFNCYVSYLKVKGVANPTFIPGEWEASGSTGTPYGRFGDEVWVADRLGRSINLGSFTGMAHFYLGIEAGIINSIGKIGSPYLTFAMYARILNPTNNLLSSTSSTKETVTAYAFRKDTAAPLYLVLINLKKVNGTTPVKVQLPALYKRARFEENRITCDDNDPNPDPARGCLYERNVARLNGTLVNSQNVLEILNSQQPIRGSLSEDGSYTFLFPNHAVIFWKITKQAPDNVAPNPAEVVCSYDNTSNNINFRWDWKEDRTCTDCYGPVGYCQRSNVSDKGFACNNTTNPPFWWQIANKKGVTEYYSYDNQNQKGVTTDASSIDRNSFSVSCNLRDGDSFKVDVDTRDAVGNMIGGPPWSNVRNAECTCGSTTTPIPLPGDLNHDNKVDIFDYNLMVQNFGNATCGNVADIDGNCKVDIYDFNTLVQNFGKTQ